MIWNVSFKKPTLEFWKEQIGNSHCLKITQNVASEFFNFGIFHQFFVLLKLKSDLFGNTSDFSKKENSLRRIFQSNKRNTEAILRTENEVIRASPSEPSTGGITRSFSQIESQPFAISGNEDGRKQAFAVVMSARQREVALARVSIYIVIVFLICHTVRIIPNSFEMVQTFIHKVIRKLVSPN